jgi:hypothetical protein
MQYVCSAQANDHGTSNLSALIGSCSLRLSLTDEQLADVIAQIVFHKFVISVQVSEEEMLISTLLF